MAFALPSQPDPDSASPVPAQAPRSALVMARLTLSAIERASDDPSLWREPQLHRALLVSGLSLLVGGLAQLQGDLG
jgi:hypothetical protein